MAASYHDVVVEAGFPLSKKIGYGLQLIGYNPIERKIQPTIFMCMCNVDTMEDKE